MAYFSKEHKAKVAPLIKAVLKKYGVKGSIKIGNHISLIVSIKSGTLDFMGADRKFQEHQVKRERLEQVYDKSGGRLHVNQYHEANWLREIKENKIAAFYDELYAAMRSADWFDNSDSQADYFHTAYYMDVFIGRWDKPYVLEA